VAKKRYDPLWEIVDEKVALQGGEPELLGHCPHCNVTLRFSAETKAGDRYECGLCGGLSEIADIDDRVTLKPIEE
jgi:hypothetical protein